MPDKEGGPRLEPLMAPNFVCCSKLAWPDALAFQREPQTVFFLAALFTWVLTSRHFGSTSVPRVNLNRTKPSLPCSVGLLLRRAASFQIGSLGFTVSSVVA